MKPLAIGCLFAFLSLARAAAENQWYVGVERTGVPLESFRVDRDSRLPVEHLTQKGPLCLSTAAAAALRFYGVEMEPARLRELGKWDPVSGKRRDFDDGSTFPQIEDVLARMDYHWSVRDFAADQEGFREGMVKIHEQIVRGHPVIVGAYFGYGGGHAVLVYGYDDLDQLVYILDSALPPPGKRLMTCDEFEMVWNLRVIGSPVRIAMFTLPKGEYPPAPEVAATPAQPATPPPPPPAPPPPSPPARPEKNVVHQTGGFRVHGSRSPSRDRSLPNSGQVADGRRAILKPFVP